MNSLKTWLAGFLLLNGVSASYAWDINKGDEDVFGKRTLLIETDIDGSAPGESMVIQCSKAFHAVAWIFPSTELTQDQAERWTDVKATLIFRAGSQTLEIDVAGDTWNKNYLAASSEDNDDVHKVVDFIKVAGSKILVGMKIGDEPVSSGTIISRNGPNVALAVDELCSNK